MSRFDYYKYDATYALNYYNEHSTADACLKEFWASLDDFCKQYDVTYDKKYFENPSMKGFQIKFCQGICIMTLSLNSNNEPESVIIRAFGFKPIKKLRDRIWQYFGKIYRTKKLNNGRRVTGSAI